MNKKAQHNKQLKQPLLRFSPRAWAKLLFMRDMSDNEVGGFGITDADDLLFVEDFVVIRQKVSPVTVEFDDEAVADFYDEQVDNGRRPEQFSRVWLHSHPCDSPEPSCTDEATFERVFGGCDWAVMFIIARNGKTFARLRFNTGPGGQMDIPVCVDYNQSFDASDFDAWRQQYTGNVLQDELFNFSGRHQKKDTQKPDLFGGRDELETFDGEDLFEEIEMMQPWERQAFMDELATRSQTWAEYESEVWYE
jgi:proteasome lid subunit RPN8/RPN11